MGKSNDSTTSVPTPDSVREEVERPSDEMVDELLQGLPEEQKNVRLDKLAEDDPASPKPPAFREAEEGKVALLNLKFENEVFFVPEPDDNGKPRFVGNTRLNFVDGYLICSRDQANFVKERAPHVYEEPREGPILEFQGTGFKTRVPAALSEYSTRWAENQ